LDLSVALDGVKSPADAMHTPLKSLDDASSAGNHPSSQYLDDWAARDRKRRQKSPESYPALAGIVGAAERFQERLRQGADLDNRHETTASVFPEGVRGSWSRQNACHGAMVASSPPNSLESSRTRRGVVPCPIALIKMTTAPRSTFLPRKRTDGGLTLFPQPSRAQQKLNRRLCSSGRSSGPPRGARGSLAQCRRPPQVHPFCRVQSARSLSIDKRNDQKLAPRSHSRPIIVCSLDRGHP
jgi:hypothetical protein